MPDQLPQNQMPVLSSEFLQALQALRSGQLDFFGSFRPSEDVQSTPTQDDWRCLECTYGFDAEVQPQIEVILDERRRAKFCSALCAEARGYHVAAQVWRASVELGQGWNVVVSRNGRRLYPGEGAEFAL